MEQIKSFVGWVTGLFFGIIALGAVTKSLVIAFVSALLAVLLIPKTRVPVVKRVPWLQKRGSYPRTVTVLVLIFFLGLPILIPRPEGVESQKTPQVVVTPSNPGPTKEQFELNRSKIVEEANAKLSTGDFATAADIAEKWRTFRDPELEKIGERATASIRERKTAELQRRLSVKNGNTIEEIYDIYRELSQLNPEQKEWEEGAKALEPQIMQIRESRNAEAAARTEAEANERRAKEYSTCTIGLFGPSVQVSGLGLGKWEYTLPEHHKIGMEELVRDISKESFRIAKACSRANNLEITLRATRLVDRFGNPASDVIARITVDLENARKFKDADYYTRDTAVATYFVVQIMSSSIARFVGE